MEHLQGHFAAIVYNMQIIPQLAQSDKLDVAAELVKGTQNIFTHLAQHAMLIAQDPTKAKTIGKQVMQGVAEVKRQIDGMVAEVGKMLEADSQQEGSGMSAEDIKLQKMQAMSQLEIYTKKTLSEISLSAIAQKHQLRSEVDEDKAATKLAEQQIETRRRLNEPEVAAQ